MKYLFLLPQRIFTNMVKKQTNRWRLLLSLHGPTALYTVHAVAEATQTWSHSGYPPNCKHCHLCLLSLFAWPSCVIAAPMCYIIYGSKSASLSYEKGFGTVGVQSKNPLLEGDKVSVFQKAQTLCHLWKYCASSLLERNPSCFRERAPCRAVVLCLRLKKVVATQQWKMDDANCKYGCF